MTTTNPVDGRVIMELVDELLVVDSGLCGVPIYPARCSHTRQKREIHLRLRDQSGKLYPKPVLRLALLHERAHMLCNRAEASHGPFFQAIFAGLITCARSLRIEIANENDVPRSYVTDCQHSGT